MRATKHLRGFQMFDIDEKYAPPEQPILDVTLIAGALHIEIATVDEKYKEEHKRTVTEIAVDARVFKAMLDATYGLDGVRTERRRGDRRRG